MQGRTILTCSDCGRTREISGEIPHEYHDCFMRYTKEEGWVPRPGATVALICGACAANYEGSETHDDEAKVEKRR